MAKRPPPEYSTYSWTRKNRVAPAELVKKRDAAPTTPIRAEELREFVDVFPEVYSGSPSTNSLLFAERWLAQKWIDKDGLMEEFPALHPEFTWPMSLQTDFHSLWAAMNHYHHENRVSDNGWYCHGARLLARYPARLCLSAWNWRGAQRSATRPSQPISSRTLR